MWRGMGVQCCIQLLLLLSAAFGRAQEDSLRSALKAVDRRQRDLTQIPGAYKNFYDRGLARYYTADDKDDLAFLKPAENRNDRKALERALLDYLDEEGSFEPELAIQDEDIKKRFSSSFRERIEKDKAKQRKELEESLMNKLDNEPDNNDDNEEYLDFAQQLYDKYPETYNELYQTARAYPAAEAKKRLFPSEYYTNLGYDSAGLKKRRYLEPEGPSDSLYMLNYAPRDELFTRLQEDEVDEPNADYYNWNMHKQDMKRDKPYGHAYSIKKKFPVSKRSNPPTHHENGIHQHQHKRSQKKRGARNLTETDPKVAKELSNVFGTEKPKVENPKEDKPKKKNDKAKKIDHEGVQEKETFKNSTFDKKEQKDKKQAANKEVLNLSKEEPLQIKKKSVDWSDYFGYDRKKKSDSDVDNQWLMERYHKAIAMSAKRNGEYYPLRNFRNHDEINAQDAERIFNKKSDLHSEEVKLAEMDSKLKNIEDSIVDEALKYTGAHEGAIDPKEVQEIKDKVISRLAAAYSLEKMRQALGEYKQSIEKQRKQLKESGKLDELSFTEEKRVSVPRKQAVDEEREKVPEGDNNIKCSQGDDDCDEQTYRPPGEILEEQSHWARGECLKVQRACSEVADVLGNYGRVLETACAMHQTCLLCGENSWFAPTRQCNVLFLTKADEACEGDPECQKIARHSVRYLLDINRSLRAEPSEDCDLLCPDNRR